MNVDALTWLAERNRPRQLNLLESIISTLAAASAVSHVLVRGSFGCGLADRSSDIDLVIGLREAKFLPFLSVLDPLMQTEFATLFPGWPDTMVGNMGGAGFVYLAPMDEALCQLDIYVTPEPNISKMVESGATVLFDRSETLGAGGGYPGRRVACEEMPEFAAEPAATQEPTDEDRVVEILIIFYMLRKRVLRGQTFIVYGQTYMLNDVLRKLIKYSFAPNSRHWGWYNLDEDLQSHPRGRECLDALRALVAAGPLRDHHDIQNTFDRGMEIVANAAPLAAARLSQSIDSYRNYLGCDERTGHCDFPGGVAPDSSADLDLAYQCGRVIGRNGLSLFHGGYNGLMECVARVLPKRGRTWWP